MVATIGLGVPNIRGFWVPHNGDYSIGKPPCNPYQESNRDPILPSESLICCA